MAIVDQIAYQDVHGIRVGRFRRKINTTCYVYAWRGNLIDAGPPNQWKFVRDFAACQHIKRVLITHHHEDHSGNASRLLNAGTPVHAPEMSVSPLRDGFPIEIYRRIVWGIPPRVTPLPFAGIPEENGLHPLLLPGHSNDMTCFLDRQNGRLFAGDLYISSRASHMRFDENAPQLLCSLDQILQSDFETVFCAHRGLVPGGKSAVQQKRDRLRSLQAKARERQRQGDTEAEITKRLLGREDLMSLMTFFSLLKAQSHPRTLAP